MKPLGLNRRNLEFVDPENPLRHRPRVDHKVVAKGTLEAAGLPVAETYLHLRYQHEVRGAMRQLQDRASFVMKPARGTQGLGVMVITRREGDYLVRSNGKFVSEEDFRFELCATLNGIYSNGRVTDHVLIEERLEEHPQLQEIHRTDGVSDLRVIVYRGKPVMGMLRLPCRASNAVANLHAGGLGLGVDFATSRTTYAIRHDRSILRHPDTGLPLEGLAIPVPDGFLSRLGMVNQLFEMDFLGVDVVFDRRHGPVILEVNARPGLAIQLANRRSLRDLLQKGGSRR